MEESKAAVKVFWNEVSCGEELYLKGLNEIDAYNNQATIRYQLEPYILSFANFKDSKHKKVLEIGVGLGADHQQFAEAGANLYGIDLTERAVENTKKRLSLFGLNSHLTVGDAELLDFEDNSFDIIYSWGVIHHSPNTQQAIKEIFRVLKPGGVANIMIYHKYSIVGYMLWIRYAFLGLKPFTSLNDIYSKYLESPGTKAYTVKEARKLFVDFSSISFSTVLTHGDLLMSDVGQRHRGVFLTVAKKIFPRFLIKKMLPTHGLFMMIKAQK